MRFALLLVAALAMVSCAADPVPITACTAGASVACTCSSGATGAQVCAADGSGYGACVCSAGDAGTDAGDAVAVGDVGPDAPQLDAVADGGRDVVAVGDVSDGGADVPGDLPCMGRAGLTYCEAPDPGCFDLSQSEANCGSCGHLCTGASRRCVDGGCSL